MENLEIICLLQALSNFTFSQKVLGGNIAYFKGSSIYIGEESNVYTIKAVEENSNYINIRTYDYFVENVLINIPYAKPVYINYNQSRLVDRGFIILS